MTIDTAKQHGLVINDENRSRYFIWGIAGFSGLALFFAVSNFSTPKQATDSVKASSEISSISNTNTETLLAQQSVPSTSPNQGNWRTGGRGPRKEFKVGILVASAEVKLKASTHRGAFLAARLLSQIEATNTGSPVLAELIQVGGEESGSIPERSMLIGKVKTIVRDRVFVDFHTVKYPDGRAFELAGELLSGDGSAGIAGRFESNRGQAVAGTMIGSFTSGLAAGFQQSENGFWGRPTFKGNARNAALQGASEAAGRAADIYTEDLRNAQPTVSVDAGANILILLTNDFKGEG